MFRTIFLCKDLIGTLVGTFFVFLTDEFLPFIEDVSTATQKAVGYISDYTGATKTVTLLADPGVFTMAATDKVVIFANGAGNSSLQAIYDLVADLATLGTGSVAVDHDSGGAGNMTFKTAGGVGIDNAIVRAYLTSDYTAGNRSDAYLKGSTITDVNGEWSTVIRLDPAAYTFEFSKQGSYQIATTTHTVT